MANLIVDIGNTAVKASWSEGMTLGKTFRYQGEKVCDFIVSLTEKIKPEVMVISSPYGISDSDRKYLERVCGSLVILDGKNKEFFNKHALPSYITSDRAASIIAVRYLFKGKGCTLIDLGTTITIDITDSEGNWMGGNISPGCRTRLKSLNRYSRALPLVSMSTEPEIFGSDLPSSLVSGVVSGIMFEIDGYLGLNPENLTVFTGGDANYFAKRMKNSIFVICNLVLMGLALIADDYVKNN